jgi:hypothetical protein
MYPAALGFRYHKPLNPDRNNREQGVDVQSSARSSLWMAPLIRSQEKDYSLNRCIAHSPRFRNYLPTLAMVMVVLGIHFHPNALFLRCHTLDIFGIHPYQRQFSLVHGFQIREYS